MAWAAACLLTYCVQVAWKLSKIVFPQRLYGERERRFWANVWIIPHFKLITNLIPYFAFKRLIFYSNMFKNKIPRDCNLNDSHKAGVASTFYSVTQRQMGAWLFVSIFVYIVYFERLRTTRARVKVGTRKEGFSPPSECHRRFSRALAYSARSSILKEYERPLIAQSKYKSCV